MPARQLMHAPGRFRPCVLSSFLKEMDMPNMKKLAVALALISSPAWAGEVTGNNDETPIASGVASSICAFSGLSDGDLGMPDPGPVQSFGQLRAILGVPAGIPGTACRGNL